MRKMMIASAVALACVSSAAVAAWTIDDNGFGFVGKGDVQLALGLNNAQMQAQARSLQFTYSDEVEGVVYCSKFFEAAGKKEAYTDYKTFKRERGVNSAVDYEARNAKQVNGFKLKGFTNADNTGGELVCPGGFDADYDTAAENGAAAGTNYVITTATGGGLSVNGVDLDPLARY